MSATTTAAPGQFEGQADVGSTTNPGTCAFDAERQVYTISGAGANIWGTHDDFHFVWKRMHGSFMLTARAAFLGQGVHAHRKLGIMLRAGLGTEAAHVCVAVHGDGLTSMQFRRAPGGSTEEARAPISHADVIQLERRGSSVIMSVARFGDLFTTEQIEFEELGDELYAGLFVCSHDDAVVEQATFANVRFVVPAADDYSRQRDPLASLLEVIDVASGTRRVLHSAPEIFEAPNWTTDGSELIYNRHGHLYRFDLATRASTMIDTGSVTNNNNDHVLSFDGTMLGISSSGPNDMISIVYTVPVTGGEPKRVTAQGPSYLHGWSPDGQYLVYTGLRDGNFDIYRIAANGGDETRLTTELGLDDGPEYSPDGAYIYFNSVRSGMMQLWRMRPDGSEQERLTFDEYNNWFPHISPDGKWIAFVSYDDPIDPSAHPPAKRVYLRIMPAEGGEPRVLAYLYGGQGTMNVPSWSPDSRSLAFVSNTTTL